MEDVQEQSNNRPWLFKKGQSGNPKGRPPGKSFKERAKHMLNAMNEEEEQEFFNGLPKIDIWKMAEGLPSQHTDITSGGKPLYIPTELLKKNELDDNPPSSTITDSK